MWIGIVSLFPEMFEALTHYGITRRAIERGILEVDTWNPRDFALDRHKTVDDKPYGGGPGMLMKVEPLHDAIQAARQKSATNCPVVYLSPQGRRLTQADLDRLAEHQELILVAGRYEGIECSGTTGYTQIKPAQEGRIHATNYYRGTYTLKK